MRFLVISLGFQKHFTPSLALVFVGLAFLTIILLGWRESEHFESVLTFASTLIGGITGFYFGGSGKSKRQENK